MQFYNTADISSMYFLFQKKTRLSVYASCLNEESNTAKHAEQKEC